MLFLTSYGFFNSCGKKGHDLKKQLFERKIISLSEEIELAIDGSNPLENDPDSVERGKGHYFALCAVCHGQNMKGVTGPNLLDDIWLHGSDNFTIYQILAQGISIDKMKLRPPKGKMPGYRDILGSRKILEVMAWIKYEKENRAKKQEK